MFFLSRVRDQFRTMFLQCFFRDPARPIEWLSLMVFAGWAQSLLSTPDPFRGPTWSAFRSFPAGGWAGVMLVLVFTQLLAMLPVVRAAQTLRFIAMALAAGLWTIVAISFWQGELISTGARTYSALAFVTALTGVYLGWTSSSSR